MLSRKGVTNQTFIAITWNRVIRKTCSENKENKLLAQFTITKTKQKKANNV